MMTLMLAVAVVACGDDDGTDSPSGDGDGAGEGGHMGDGDGDHQHDGCGLQTNCNPDAPELSSQPRVDGDHVSMMVHMPSDYAENEESSFVEATMMLHFMDGEGENLAGSDVTLHTYSEDCLHKGPTPDVTGTTNDGGMVEFTATFTHGGPWSIVAEVNADGMTHKLSLELCVPGADHGGNADHSMHMGDGDGDGGDHSGHQMM